MSHSMLNPRFHFSGRDTQSSTLCCRTFSSHLHAQSSVLRTLAFSCRLLSPQSSVLSPGFTLMEILVAMVILGVVVTTVLASFSMVFSTTGSIENAQALFDMGKTSLNRIVRDLENCFVLDRPLYKPPVLDGPLDPYRFQGSVDSFGGTQLAKLRFTSRAHVPLSPSRRDGIAEIVYYLQPDGAGTLRLKRADHLFPYPRFEERNSDPVLCENVKTLAFDYVDAEGSVTDAWDSESSKYGNATPVMVAVRLEVAEGNDSYVFQTSVTLPMARRKSG